MFETTNQPCIVVKKLHDVYVAKKGTLAQFIQGVASSIFSLR